MVQPVVLGPALLEWYALLVQHVRVEEVVRVVDSALGRPHRSFPRELNIPTNCYGKVGEAPHKPWADAAVRFWNATATKSYLLAVLPRVSELADDEVQS